MPISGSATVQRLPPHSTPSAITPARCCAGARNKTCGGQEEQHVGDIPHNWASAEFIHLVRHLLVLERGEELHLLYALPRMWTKGGDRTEIVDIPTSFGPISLTLDIDQTGESSIIRIDPHNREPPREIVMHLEHFHKSPKRVASCLEDSDFLVNVDFNRLP
ncbi:MAG TPA: hypothetical protein VMW72_20190 [Sedimentisphaerales bacterium]|nr:hypothetical protein [Sedimentisphaerales bacterium]